MSQEYYTIIRRKSDKKEIATLDCVCGRSDYHDILSQNITFDKEYEHIITSVSDEEINKAMLELDKSENLLKEHLKLKLSDIQNNTLLLSTAKTKEMAEVYHEKISDLEYDIVEEIEEDYLLINHLYSLLDKAILTVMDIDKDYEVVLCWSF